MRKINKIYDKKGQIAIFVIIAIVIVAILVIFFMINRKPILPNQEEFNLQSSIEKCTRDSSEEALDIMIPQGGFIEPENYKTYKNIKTTYLCQNTGYFKPCISQHPMLINEEINEVENYITPLIEQCFLTVKTELEKRNYAVTLEPMKLNVSFGTNKVLVSINRKISLTKNEQTSRFDEFNIAITNPIYDLSKVAIEIASQEAKFCYFEYVGYMILYPKFSIEKFAFSDATKIYSIRDKNSNKEMNIATRSCAIPPGI